MTRIKPLILAAEDDEDFRKALEMVLQRFGLSFMGTATSRDFLHKSEMLKPDLYLIDLQLGASSGFDLISELRGNQNITAPILVISGANGSEQISHALELGANDFITKPLDRVFLASKLSLYLKSEAMETHRATFKDLPGGITAARLSLAAKVIAIDEIGMKLQSPSLVPKGTVVKIKSNVLKDAGIPDGETLVSIISSDLDPATQLYTLYAEFDGVEVEFLQTVRRWLAQ